METTNNPYQTPGGQLTLDDNEFGEVRFFSPSSRIGRLRYLAHGFIVTLAIYLVLAIGAGLAVGVSPVFWALFAIGYVGMFVFSFVLIIQRLHDLNQTGWLSLLILVPLVNFFFILFVIFAPGTKGANNYGLQPPPNKTWHWIFGLMGPILGIIAVIGILAAVSIPAYQDYIQRASESSDSYSSEYYYDYDDEEDDE